MSPLPLPFSRRAALALLALALPAQADPLITSWVTHISSKYARIYTSTANRTAGTSSTTWSGTISQTSPAYAGVNEVNSSATWVYIRTTGLAAHVMGPWQNPNLPKNQAIIYRFPRTPTIPGTKTLTNMGSIGYMVDGVAAYNTSDGFAYSNSNSMDAAPTAGIGPGDGIWNRDALPNESVSFDFALAHNQPAGEYHYHVNPVATRYLLGDNVTYNSTTKNYAENTSTTSFQHSPLIGWMKDGLPLYGPYGYDGGSTGATATASLSGTGVSSIAVTAGGSLYQSVPLVTFSGGGGTGAAATAVLTGGIVTALTLTNGGTGYSSAPTVTIGGVRRMISGYQLRDGTHGTTNLTATGRTTLPIWALAAQNRAQLSSATQYGPATTYSTGSAPNITNYTLGHYAEDYDYLGDLSYTQSSRTNSGGVFFDLNKYNTRFCVTPEYPNGTWAYFTTIKTDGSPMYPYSVGRWYYGSPTGASTTAATMNADAPLTNNVLAGANTPLTVSTPSVASPTVTLTWSSLEGGTYSVDASPNQSIWTSQKTGLLSVGGSTSTSYTQLGTSGTEYARVNRTALPTFDSTGQTAATAAQSSITSYSLGGTNTAPTISAIGAQSTLQNTATSAIAFTIGDAETPAASLTVSATSSNTTLVPNGNIILGGSGASRSATIVPATDQTGTATITLSVNDGSATTGSGFALTVSASTAPVLAVTPATALSASGVLSGPFSPGSATYTLTNTGNAPMTWTASKTASWITLSPTGGSLSTGANTTVTATINTAANSLSGGSYSDTLTFTNSTNGSGNATRSVALAISAATPAAPVLTALPIYSAGTSKTLTWSAVANAVSYTVQLSSSADFTTGLISSQTLSSPSVAFTKLTDGATYFYRVLATNGAGSSAYSNTVSSTQDALAPAVAIISPITGISTATNTVTFTGTSADTLSGITRVSINAVTASTTNNFATWTITVPLGFGTNALTATAVDGAGNQTTTSAVLITLTTAQTYNPLIIPDTLTGTTFNLTLNARTRQFLTGTATNTNAYNNALFWGPTLIMNKGDFVQMSVTNNLPVDTTTTHWHGFHIPAIMDGGPHQTIPAGTVWKPSWTVLNDAGTYWYHPHLHEKTQEQITRGAGGLIIIRDAKEAALNLPRTYGIDDIPVVMSSRRFTSNQVVTVNCAYGDQMVVNGTLSPQMSLPKQYVRLRMLNAEIERALNIGFSDGRTFYVIGTDGGLVNAPVATTRVVLGVGERSEILVDLGSDTVGSSLDLMAYNSNASLPANLRGGYPGGEPATTGQFGSLINNADFKILHINVAATTTTAVTSRPSVLNTNTYWTPADVTNSRTLNITDGFPGTLFRFNSADIYSPTVINQTLKYNAVEKWTITNSSGFSHSFHIHDIQFALISRTGGTGAIASYEQGWKDTLYIAQNSTVVFIAKFDTFASNTNPFMYHCHFANHEDEGLMGQFLVINEAVEDLALASFTRTGADNNISLKFKATPGTTYALQYSTDLTTGSWSDVGSVTSDGSSANFLETDSTRLAQGRGFYRIKIPTIP